MKRLKVPVIPVLDVLDITSIEPILEVQSQREFLTHANWHEYPYKPITAYVSSSPMPIGMSIHISRSPLLI